MRFARYVVFFLVLAAATHAQAGTRTVEEDLFAAAWRADRVPDRSAKPTDRFLQRNRFDDQPTVRLFGGGTRYDTVNRRDPHPFEGGKYVPLVTVTIPLRN